MPEKGLPSKAELKEGAERFVEQSIGGISSIEDDPDFIRFRNISSLCLIYADFMPNAGIDRDQTMIRGGSALMYHQIARAALDGEPVRLLPTGRLYSAGEMEPQTPSDLDVLVLDDAETFESLITSIRGATNLFFDVRQLKSGRKSRIANCGVYRFANGAITARVHTLPPQPQIDFLTQMNTVIPKGVLGPTKLTHRLSSSEPDLFRLCSEYLPLFCNIRVATLAFLAFSETLMPRHGRGYMQELYRLGLEPGDFSFQDQIFYLSRGFDTNESGQRVLAEKIIENII